MAAKMTEKPVKGGFPREIRLYCLFTDNYLISNIGKTNINEYET